MFLAIRPTKVVQHLKNINNKKYLDTNINIKIISNPFSMG